MKIAHWVHARMGPVQFDGSCAGSCNLCTEQLAVMQPDLQRSRVRVLKAAWVLHGAACHDYEPCPPCRIWIKPRNVEDAANLRQRPMWAGKLNDNTEHLCKSTLMSKRPCRSCCCWLSTERDRGREGAETGSTKLKEQTCAGNLLMHLLPPVSCVPSISSC